VLLLIAAPPRARRRHGCTWGLARARPIDLPISFGCRRSLQPFNRVAPESTTQPPPWPGLSIEDLQLC
jgi:hypothetical protein